MTMPHIIFNLFCFKRENKQKKIIRFKIYTVSKYAILADDSPVVNCSHSFMPSVVRTPICS